MRAVKMALAHDMGEAIVGDITPSDGVPRGIVYCSLSVLNGFLMFHRREAAQRTPRPCLPCVPHQTGESLFCR